MSGLRHRLTRAWDALRGDPYDARWLHKRSAMTRALNRLGFVVVRGDMVRQYPEVRGWLDRDDQQEDYPSSP